MNGESLLEIFEWISPEDDSDIFDASNDDQKWIHMQRIWEMTARHNEALMIHIEASISLSFHTNESLCNTSELWLIIGTASWCEPRISRNGFPRRGLIAI